MLVAIPTSPQRRRLQAWPMWRCEPWPFFMRISGRNFLPELWGEVHPETVPLQDLCCALCPTELSRFLGREKGEKGRKRGGQQRGQKGKRTRKNRSGSDLTLPVHPFGGGVFLNQDLRCILEGLVVNYLTPSSTDHTATPTFIQGFARKTPHMPHHSSMWSHLHVILLWLFSGCSPMPSRGSQTQVR